MWTRHHIKNTQEPNSLNFCGGGPKESLLGRKESGFLFYFTAFFYVGDMRLWLAIFFRNRERPASLQGVGC